MLLKVILFKDCCLFVKYVTKVTLSNELQNYFRTFFLPFLKNDLIFWFSMGFIFR